MEEVRDNKLADNGFPDKDLDHEEVKDKNKPAKTQRIRKPLIKFDSIRLIDPSIGLKQLYMNTKDFKPSGNPVCPIIMNHR